MMKYLFAFLLTLLVGYGQGQTTTGNPHDILTIQGPCNITEGPCDVLAAPTCDYTIEFHGKQKAIKEIWPEECAIQVEWDEGIDVESAKSYPSPAGEIIDRGLPFHTITPESPDVPAIQGKGCELTDQQIKQGYCCSTGGWQMDCPHHVDGKPYCADKSRILLTAEDGRKWCHKPESSPKP
jgi:hypothetical protein